jgi:hypothetical protein
MAYDEGLAGRVRDVLAAAGEPPTEKRIAGVIPLLRRDMSHSHTRPPRRS